MHRLNLTSEREQEHSLLMQRPLQLQSSLLPDLWHPFCSLLLFIQAAFCYIFTSFTQRPVPALCRLCSNSIQANLQACTPARAAMADVRQGNQIGSAFSKLGSVELIVTARSCQVLEHGPVMASLPLILTSGHLAQALYESSNVVLAQERLGVWSGMDCSRPNVARAILESDILPCCIQHELTLNLSFV